MDLLARLADWSLLALFMVLLACCMVAREVGCRIGRESARTARRRDEHIGLVVASVLSLVAFVLALTLSLSTSRFDERRHDSLSEANAIGTAWLQARAIGGPRGDAIAALFVPYIEARIRYVAADMWAEDIALAQAETNALQNQIWEELTPLLRADASPRGVSLMNAINLAFDASVTVRFGLESRLPAQLIWLMLGMTMLGLGTVGFQAGLNDRPHRPLDFLLCLLWVTVVFQIMDIGSARIGTYRTDPSALIWTRDGILGG